MSISKIVIPNFVCVVQMKDTKHIFFVSVGIFILSPWSCPRGVTLGRRGPRGGGVKNVFFFKNGHVAYQTEGDDEQNKMQENVSS